MSVGSLAVKLDPETRQRLQRLAEAKKCSPDWLMKEALREYVDREEYAEKQRQETVERWEAYKAGDSRVSHEAVMAWLDTWGREDETKRPPCEK